MEVGSNIFSVNQAHAHYITYTESFMDGTEPKYQKARYIASETMCTNPDVYFDIYHCKCFCFCYQQCPSLFCLMNIQYYPHLFPT